jgi:hypothetical protein
VAHSSRTVSSSFARTLPSDDMLKISIPEKKRGPAEGPSFDSGFGRKSMPE